MGVGEPLGEIVSALRTTVNRVEATADLVGRAGGVEVSRHRHHPRLDGCRGHRVEGVQQRRRGDVGGRPITDRGGQPRLGQSGHRRLGDHESDHRNHEITRQKSRAATTLPRSEPLTLDLPPVRGP